MSEYTCERCKLTFKKIRTHEECLKEFQELFPEVAHHEITVICDDCFVEFMGWFRTLTEEQKKHMRDEYEKNMKVH